MPLLTPHVLVFFMFNDLRLAMAVRLVDIVGLLTITL